MAEKQVINKLGVDAKARVKYAQERRDATTYEPVKPEQQWGFIHNNMDCIGCRACEIACKDKNGLPPGPRFRRVMYIEGGAFPDVFAYKVNMSCNHCAEPACLPTCPTGAIWKRADNGVVDIDSTLCIGCRRCEAACPYGAPQYSAAVGAMLKCDGCRDRVAEGKKPVCVEACPLRALDLLPIDELRKKYGSLSEVAPLKPAHLTRPALSIMPGKRTRPQGDKAGFIANPKEV